MSVINLKDKIGVDLLALTIDNVFTKDECDAIIADADDKEFHDEHVNKYGAVFKNENIRTDLILSEDNRLLSHTIFMRIKDVIRTHDSDITKLSTHLKYSKYITSGFSVPHVDKPIVKDGSMSKYTIILYLNTDSKGHTRLFNIETMKYYDVKPLCGRVLIFDQRVPYAALNAASVKYTLRSDILMDDPYRYDTSGKIMLNNAVGSIAIID